MGTSCEISKGWLWCRWPSWRRSFHWRQSKGRKLKGRATGGWPNCMELRWASYVGKSSCRCARQTQNRPEEVRGSTQGEATELLGSLIYNYHKWWLMMEGIGGLSSRLGIDFQWENWFELISSLILSQMEPASLLTKEISPVQHTSLMKMLFLQIQEFSFAKTREFSNQVSHEQIMLASWTKMKYEIYGS